jgi:predicted metal-binding membrane protein
VIAGSWLYLFAMSAHGMRAPATWSPQYFAVMAAMWIVMMAAMMLPGATPMILLHATLARRRYVLQRAAVAANGLFALGYVAVWSGFALGATVLQWALADAALLSPMTQASSKGLAGTLLVAAGIYQFTPLKQTCLRHCRSPLDFIMSHWRNGPAGSYAMGVRHGAYCLGCCWALMLLLFVGGVMSLAWIAGLASFVLVERLAPYGHWTARLAGVALLGWGAVVLAKLA